MKTYAIMVDDGYGLYKAMKYGVATTFIKAENAKQARKEFLRKWEGTWQANATFRVTEISTWE